MKDIAVKQLSEVTGNSGMGEIQYTADDVAVKQDIIYLFVKRCFDLTVSLCTGIVLCIPMLLISLLLKLDSPGPVLFKQERLGKDGKPFMMYKFRSMSVDAEKNGPQWADKDDERCTRFGKILRDFRHGKRTFFTLNYPHVRHPDFL